MPPQNTPKHFAFTGTPGSFAVMYIVALLLMIIPFVGFAFSFNYQNKWLLKNIKIDGRNLAYNAGFGEVWVLLFVGIILTVLTFGIYTFWFTPKLYRFVLAHTSYADEVAVEAPVSEVGTPAPETNETAPTLPANPTV